MLLCQQSPYSQSCGFSSSNVWMIELDHKEGWAPNNWFFWTVVLEKIPESPLDCKEIKRVNPKGNQSWIFIGRTDAEAQAPIVWPPVVKSWHIGNDPDAGKDWRQEEKWMTDIIPSMLSTSCEILGWMNHKLDWRQGRRDVRWLHWINAHEFEQALGDGEGQKSGVLQSMGSQSDTTERLNSNKNKRNYHFLLVWGNSFPKSYGL